MKKVYPVSAAIALAFAAVAMSACVDNDYDLSEDLDLTVAIGGSEFAIPGGMTEEIKLSKVLEVEEDDIIQVDGEGNYYLYQEGDPTLSKVSVKGFDIKSPDNINPTIKNLNFSSPAVPPPGTTTGSQTVVADVPLDDQPATFKLEETDLPEELKKVSFINLDMDVNIRFSYTTAAGIGVINKIKMEEIKVFMPEYFVSDKLEEGNVFYIRNKIIGTGEDNLVTVHIQGFDCNKLPDNEGIDSNLHTLLMTGEMNMMGTFSANTSDFTGGTPTSLTLTANYELANIKVNKIKGIVKPDIPMDVEPVKLNDIPDFLSDDEVKLDVENPMIYLSLDNQIPVEAGITGSLSSYKNNKLIAGPIPVAIKDIQAEQNQLFCLSPKGTDEEGVRNIIVPELNQLIEKIPDEIRFDVDIAATDKEAEVELNKEYTINTGYSLNVPFVFGPSLSIVYKDTIDGWQDDLEDFEIAALNVTSKVINKIPLDLIFTAEAITTDGSGEHTKLDAVTAKVKVNNSENDNTIKAGNTEGSETSIVIEIKEVTEGGIKQLDGLILRAVAKSGQENKVNRLNENQTIQLKELKIKVPGGIKVNLN